MIASLAARWLLTAVFAAAGLTAALPQREPAGSARPPGRFPVVFCGVMCAALIAMAWQPEPAAATWLQAALFGGAALWSGLASLASSGRVWQPSLSALPHTLMAGAMIWMLTTMPGGAGHGAMTRMPPTAMPAALPAVSILLAVSCAAASIPWLAQGIGPGPRVKDPVSASQAAMSAGMAAMLFATL
jgi:hypothetical protein